MLPLIMPPLLPGTDSACEVIIRKDENGQKVREDSELYRQVTREIHDEIRKYEEIPEHEQWMEDQKQNEKLRKAWNGEDWHKTMPGSFDQWMSKERMVNVRQCQQCYYIFRTIFEKNNHNIEMKAGGEGRCMICSKRFRLAHQFFVHKKYCGFPDIYVSDRANTEKQKRRKEKRMKEWLLYNSPPVSNRHRPGSVSSEPTETSPVSGNVSNRKRLRSDSSNRLLLESNSQSPRSSLGRSSDSDSSNDIQPVQPIRCLYPNPPGYEIIPDYDPR